MHSDETWEKTHLLFVKSGMTKRVRDATDELRYSVTSSSGVCFSGFPGRFVPLLASLVTSRMLLRIRGFCFFFEFVNSAQQQPVCYLISFFCIQSSSQDSMHCTLSLTVCKCTPCQRASCNSTTDSFSWGHDPCTLACKARPSFDRCWTSLSFIVIVIVKTCA